MAGTGDKGGPILEFLTLKRRTLCKREIRQRETDVGQISLTLFWISDLRFDEPVRARHSGIRVVSYHLDMK